MFSVERRASPVGALVPAALLRRRRSPRVGVVPVRPAPLAVICVLVGLLQRAPEEHVDVRRVDRAAAGLDVVGADVRERLERGVDLRARSRCTASGAVVWPLKVSVNVPPVALVTRTVCCSSSFWSLERAVAAGVDAAGRRVVTRDHPQVVVLVEVDVAGDVAALLAVVGDPQDLLLGAQVEVRRDARGVVDELEARELEVADVRIPRRLATAADVRRRSCSASSA